MVLAGFVAMFVILTTNAVAKEAEPMGWPFKSRESMVHEVSVPATTLLDAQATLELTADTGTGFAETFCGFAPPMRALP
jgi:hypothetical protein